MFNKITKKIISILLFSTVVVFSTSCSSPPRNPESWMEMEKNACLPTAIAFREGLRKYDVWAEVVLYYWVDKKTKERKGHAITAYMYPPGKNQLWTYDFWGSYRIRAYKDHPFDIAQKASDARHEERQVIDAYFLK